MLLLSNPIYWIFIITCLIIIFVLTRYGKNILGWFGEHWVKEVLSKLDKKEYIVLNDVMLYVDGKSHQIDHIVVSKYGVFVIETKQYNGYITGSKYDVKWIRHVGKNKYYYTNPIRQNYGHVKCVCSLLGIGEDKVFNVVCIPSKAKLKIEHDGELVRNYELYDKIVGYKNVVIDDVDGIIEVLRSSNVTDRDARRKHIKEVHEIVNGFDEKMCPKCGGKLVEKIGKYGKFVGCDRYPKCRYVRKEK